MNKKAAQLEYWYIVGFNLAVLILSFTSMPVVFLTAREWFVSMGVPYLAVLAGANVVTIAYYGSVELLISILLPYAAGELTSKRMKGYEKKKKRYVRTVLFVGFILTSISMSMSYFFSQDAADSLVKAPDISHFEAVQKTQSSDYTATLSAIDAELKEARRTEKKRVAAAVANGPDRWQELYAEKNSWFMRQKGNIGAYVTSIQAERDKVRQLEEQKREVLTTGASKKDDILATVAGVQAAEVKTAQEKRNRRQATLFIIACGAGVVAVIFAFMLGLHRDAEGQQVEDAPMSPAMLLSRGFGRVWRAVSDGASQRFDLSFSGATGGATGATMDATPATTTPTDPTSARGEALSDGRDSVSHIIAEKVTYVDMKNHIDRISKRYRRAWKKNERDKMRQVVADDKDGVAWLRSLGFSVSVDEANGKISVKKT